ncbi:flagellin C-terminal helical region [Pseudobutyrivibrio sp. ACV-2]|uniref:flagellin N-terminal helical domain-containing protein n=1 Tax=Pseudobutyrivibrio sp. ACV-2 TaxID=1520801 RepID=UPI00089AE9E4|nr:flagellin [Pseudobutyrivibrio sp. ACV-2]SEA64882.1 flagellin C-terminal helical region [Pseudobutyrivibrio sp. ACV-2]
MVVQHNMQAANASRMLGITTTAQGKTSEKLSSGFRINRAADDAAGLSISEKMRKQIRGLDQASTNASDGISAVQTAEGALTEVHSMLQRMNELAVQAANGTNSGTDRQSIQDEIYQLTTEIDRVAETTKFNETYLLKGAPDGVKLTKNVSAHDAGLDGKLVGNAVNGTSLFTLNKKLEAGDRVMIGGKEYNIGSGKSTDSYRDVATLQSTALKVGDSVTVDGKTITLTKDVKATSVIGTTPVVGDQIIAKDGTVYEYKAASSVTGGPVAGWYDKSTYQDTALYGAESHSKATGQIALDGATWKHADAASGLNEFKIVDNIKDGEKSAFGLGSGGTITADNLKGSALAPGDTVTQSGEEKTAVATANATINSLQDVAKAIGALDNTKKVTISNIDGTNSQQYNIAETADQENKATNTLTREHIIELLKEGQQVDVAGTKMTVAGVEAADTSKISKTRAYTLMAEELQKASSIGTDTEAKVTNNNDGTFLIKQGTVSYASSLTFNLHVGADADMTNKINVEIDTMNAAYLGIKKINVADDTGISATYAIDAISDALAKVSAQRSALGAVQNRLEHSIANLDNIVENSTAAESRIRDTDMADTMVTYSKNNILAQAGQSMLAQANQSTQGVMSILQ